jgi:hypothetical protein
MENKKNEVFSKTFQDGTLLETIFTTEGKTAFAIAKGGEIKIVENYTDDSGQVWVPISAESVLITKGFVKLASGLEESGELADLFAETKSFISSYVKIPDDFLTVATLYVFMTWVYDKFQTLPYLRVVGDFGTGKSRFLQAVGNLCYKAMLAGGSISTSAVFRTVDQIGGTLVFDEADFRNSNAWADIVKILNGGHTTGSPVVRMNFNDKTKEFEVHTFKVFGPKILASRERFGDEALESRCLSQHLLPIKNSGIPAHLPSDFDARACHLRNKFLSFRLGNFEEITTDESTLGEIEFPRLKQSALAMTSLAALISEEVLNDTLKYLSRYEKESSMGRKHDVKADVLECILVIAAKRLARAEHSGKIYIGEIKTEFETRNYNDYATRPDKVYGDGPYTKVFRQQEISARKIGEYVRDLGFSSERDGHGFYLFLPSEAETLGALVERYDLENFFKEQKEEWNKRINGDSQGEAEEIYPEDL